MHVAQATLSGSGSLMPYDDRSNYKKGGAEEFFVIRYSSVHCLDEITQKATQRREGPLSLIEDPSRGPQAIFFDPPPWPESWQRNKTTKRNWVPPWRLQPLASHYFKLHIVLHCLQSVEMLFVAEIESPTNVKEVNEGCHALFSKHLTFQKCLNLTEQENCINNNSQFDLSGFLSSCHLVNHISPAKICRAIYQSIFWRPPISEAGPMSQVVGAPGHASPWSAISKAAS